MERDYFGRGTRMLSEALVALATAGGTTLMAAAATDAWGTAKDGMARLLSRGHLGSVEVVEGRLEQSRVQLASLAGAELEQARQVQAQAWTVRLQDLLEEAPDAEDGLRRLLQELASVGVPAVSTGDNQGVVAGGNVSITATHGAIAAGIIHGGANMAVNPTPPDQGQA
ncbi:hypothetical protein ACWKSP_01980 [Micromonosporaceae bacterium Da 78-11]